MVHLYLSIKPYCAALKVLVKKPCKCVDRTLQTPIYVHHLQTGNCSHRICNFNGRGSTNDEVANPCVTT